MKNQRLVKRKPQKNGQIVDYVDRSVYQESENEMSIDLKDQKWVDRLNYLRRIYLAYKPGKKDESVCIIQLDAKKNKQRKRQPGSAPIKNMQQLEIPPGNLRKKYYHPQIETYHYRASNNILYDPYSLQNIQLMEMRKLMDDSESLRHYYTFNQTAQVIRGVIIKRVEKDFYGWVDFQPGHFLITNSYYLRRKQLVQSGRMMEKYLKSTSDMQSTGSGDDKHVREYIRERIKKELDQQRLVVPNQTNSTIDLKKLTKNIEVMVEKIADLSAIHPIPKKKQSPQSQPFQFSQLKEISVIRKTDEVHVIEGPANYQESYGLDTIKPKQNRGKKVNKLGLRSMDKLGVPEEMRLPPETPTPRMIHKFDYAEHQETHHGKSKSRSKKMVPLSPCSHSSSMSGKNSSQSKSKSSRRRR